MAPHTHACKCPDKLTQKYTQKRPLRTPSMCVDPSPPPLGAVAAAAAAAAAAALAVALRHYQVRPLLLHHVDHNIMRKSTIRSGRQVLLPRR